MSEGQSRPSDAILETVARYYADRLRQFGTTPQGVDWKSAESQALRFERLMQVADGHAEASVNDYGCGYGALVDYLADTGRTFTYRGFDASDAMIASARARYDGVPRCSFTNDLSELPPADYTVASGIFNVKLHFDDVVWLEYVLETLRLLVAASTRGVAFNMLSTYSDPEKRRADLFYGDPRQMFDHCKREFSPRVALLHDYPLYEFTIIVRI
jgi:SAM-dependent methyltransferase